MDESQLREIASEYLAPLFSGARLEAISVPSKKRDSLVALVDPCTIQFKTEKTDSYRLVIKRSQAFSRVTGGVIAESHIVDAFVAVLKEIQSGLSEVYKADLLATFQRRVVAKSIALDEMQPTLLAGLDQMTQWASRLYEGKSIAATFGFSTNAVANSATLHKICLEDFSAVLSNGFDTLLAINAQGYLLIQTR